MRRTRQPVTLAGTSNASPFALNASSLISSFLSVMGGPTRIDQRARAVSRAPPHCVAAIGSSYSYMLIRALDRERSNAGWPETCRMHATACWKPARDYIASTSAGSNRGARKSASARSSQLARTSKKSRPQPETGPIEVSRVAARIRLGEKSAPSTAAQEASRDMPFTWPPRTFSRCGRGILRGDARDPEQR